MGTPKPESSSLAWYSWMSTATPGSWPAPPGPRRGQAGQHAVRLLAGLIGDRPPEAHGAGGQARGKGGDTEVHRLETRARVGDRLDVRHPQGRLDQHVDSDAMRDATGGFDLGEQGVHEIDVRRDADLRDQHDVQLVPRLLHHV